MTTSTRQQILVLLTELGERHPDWRFGQLVENVSMWAKGPGLEAIWDVEDEEFLQALKDHLQHQPVSSEPN